MNTRTSPFYSVMVKLLILATAVSGQKCVDTVGSLAHNRIDVPYNQTFIFTDHDYTIPCEGTVTAWEFCYKVQKIKVPVTFYPGVWMVDEAKNGVISYSLVQSNIITFMPSQVHDNSNEVSCQTFNLSLSDQFIASVGSVVGLYSNTRTAQVKLLRTYKASSCITTYHSDGNQSFVQATTTDHDANVGYNIAIRVHLGNVATHAVVNHQRCTDNVGSLIHDNIYVSSDQTFIFADRDYTMFCGGIVIAWEFCYRVQQNEGPVTFYPGVWMVTKTENGVNNYSLVQLSSVTFTASQVGDSSIHASCQRVNLSTTDQFTAPAGSVVGLYSNTDHIQPKLLRTYRASSCITTYGFDGNQSVIQANDDDNVGYNIAIRVHLDIQCLDLSTLKNGDMLCSSGRVGVGYVGDTCSFTCNTGYKLTGSSERTCQSDGSWSGSPVSCIIMECPSSSLPMNSMLAKSCSSTYQSMCELQCQEGFNGTGDPSYVCDVLSDGSSVMWMAEGDAWNCERVPCVSLSDPENGNVTCPSNTSVFQDTCAYYCNHGYQLEGDRQTRCRADGMWSSEPVTCTILKCNDPEVEIANSQSVGVCNVTYGSSCSLNCLSGFSVSGNGEHVCDDVNDEGTSVKWRSVGKAFRCVVNGTFTDSESDILIIAGPVGGATLLFLVFTLCAVILCIRRNHKKRSHEGSREVNEQQSSEVNITSTNNIAKLSKQDRKSYEDHYNYIIVERHLFQGDTHNTSVNPLCRGNTAAYDITTVHLNFHSSNLKQNTKSSENEYLHIYTESTQCCSSVTERMGYTRSTTDVSNLKVDPNPSYDVASGGVKLKDNPSYQQSTTNAKISNPNPSCNLVSDGVKLKGIDKQSTRDVMVNPNPSYGLTSAGVKLKDNPSYKQLLNANM